MTDDEIRTIVRQVLAARGFQAPPPPAPRPHVSHVRLTMVAATEPGSPCVIEPAVACNGCGYCLSLGH
ncbi:MAG TPA: hypothetical protein VF198_15490 [Vicinamibacterales bacterium]